MDGYGDLPALFVDQRTAGPVRAGLIKVAGAFHHLDERTRHVLAAAADAHHATGAPIGVHLEGGTAAMAILDELAGTHDVPPHRIILGHLHRFLDSTIHTRVAAAGAFVGFEGRPWAQHAIDWRLMNIIADGPGMPFLLHTLRPRVEDKLGTKAATAIFRTDPARAFAVEWRNRSVRRDPLVQPVSAGLDQRRAMP
ncbi:hypothetical protein [Nocardia sp. NPDC052112]|uniref:phosphotriesterase family protein n=1 Tax=Nocardia sp. NPDC052112 TaxID=3155646 RepID=UPI00342DC280